MEAHLTWANPRYYWGFGFGADINGLGAQGDPRPTPRKNPVTYPFTELGGVKVDQQVSGQRVYDINKDGVAHYGLYPDWMQDLKCRPATDIVEGHVARPRGLPADVGARRTASPTTPAATRSAKLSPRRSRPREPGTSPTYVLTAAGQPHRRLGTDASPTAAASTGGRRSPCSSAAPTRSSRPCAP